MERRFGACLSGILLMAVVVSCGPSGKEISVMFSSNPHLPDEAAVFWNDIQIGEVRSTQPGSRGDGVRLKVRIYSDYQESLDGSMLFYRETSLLGAERGQDLKAFKCESRETTLPHDLHFEGYFGYLKAKADCVWGQTKTFLATTYASAKEYWSSPEGQERRRELEERFEKAKHGAGEAWEDLKVYGDRVAEDMREKGWDKEAEAFLKKVEKKIHELTSD